VGFDGHDLPSYALENHGFYHPTYEMVAGMSLGDSLLMAKLASTTSPPSFNLRRTQCHGCMDEQSKQLLMDSGDFAYPPGWTGRFMILNRIPYHLDAAHFNDPLATLGG